MHMTKPIMLFTISSLLFLGWVCGGETPISPEDETDLLFASFFESNATPDMKGWSYSDSSARDFITASKDVPTTGNFYSVKLQSDTVNHFAPGILATIVNPHPYPKKQYVLSFYSKGKGEVLVDFRSTAGIQSMLIHINNTSWQSDSQTPLFNCSNSSDTLVVRFRPLSNDPISYLFLDNVSVEARKP